jgi:uncharacterized protein (DUF1786 family)
MKILAVDIGTGTQDILLFDSRAAVENSLKMVQPSPTMITHRQIKEATRQGKSIVLTGVTMGGGPSHWAVEGHIEAGLPVYATPEAARSFNDDLDLIRESGIEVISEDEAVGLPGEVQRFDLRDFDFKMIVRAFESFDVSLSDVDLIAAAVFDHGAAPPGYSDRLFRFEYIRERVSETPALTSFAFREAEIPAIMTRMKAVSASLADTDIPLMVMDTAPAAVLGAMMDPVFARGSDLLLTNVGNFHTIGFLMKGAEIGGVFEHHTGLLDTEKLDGLLTRLGDGSIRHEEVFEDHGHGALTFSTMEQEESVPDFGVAVTGPRWTMMRNSRLCPYFATPFGDMMMAGCFGLIKAAGTVIPEHAGEIDTALGQGHEKPPWELA